MKTQDVAVGELLTVSSPTNLCTFEPPFVSIGSMFPGDPLLVLSIDANFGDIQVLSRHGVGMTYSRVLKRL